MKKDLEKEIRWLLKEKYHHKPTQKFEEDVKRLKAGEPIDYVIGFTDFLNCKIDLSKKPLIPRQDTAFWVEKEIKEIKKSDKKDIKCLDIFSGSGCIGVALLKQTDILRRSDKNVAKYLLCDMADSQKNCLEQIKMNCQINKINPKRYKIIKSDVFSKVKEKYDFIFANPPYVATKKIYNVQKSVLKYEPKTALFAGSDGLYYIKKFLSEAKKHLRQPASAEASAWEPKIFMEFSPEQKPAIEKIILKNKYSNFEFKKDQNERWRWVIVQN